MPPQTAVDSRFPVGSTVLLRGPFIDESGLSGDPEICDVKPMVVVRDSPELIALWLPAGTRTWASVPTEPGRPLPWRRGEWRLQKAVWKWCSGLFLIVPGEWRAIWLLWAPLQLADTPPTARHRRAGRPPTTKLLSPVHEGEFMGWYINLQEPVRRTPVGFDSRDLQLDIVVDAERRWRWKDEDELRRSVVAGVLSAVTAERARAEGLRTIREIEAGTWPFTDEWRTWEPNPAWPRPAMNHPDDAIKAIYSENEGT